jgi:hypothetical protein
VPPRCLGYGPDAEIRVPARPGERLRRRPQGSTPPDGGISPDHAIGNILLDAVREEFEENEDLPNTANPDDWAKIAGKKGERIVSIKPLTGESTQEARDVERVVATGQYL